MTSLPQWFITRYPQFGPKTAPLADGEVYVPPPAPPPRVITGPIISTADWSSTNGQDAEWSRTGTTTKYNKIAGQDHLRSKPVLVAPGQVVKIAATILGQKNTGTGNQFRGAKGGIGITPYRQDGRALGATYLELINSGTSVAEMVMPPLTHYCVFSLVAHNTSESGTYTPDNPAFDGDYYEVEFIDLERAI